MDGPAEPVSKLDGKAPESTDFANYFCTYAYIYHQVKGPSRSCLIPDALVVQSVAIHIAPSLACMLCELRLCKTSLVNVPPTSSLLSFPNFKRLGCLPSLRQGMVSS